MHTSCQRRESFARRERETEPLSVTALQRLALTTPAQNPTPPRPSASGRGPVGQAGRPLEGSVQVQALTKDMGCVPRGEVLEEEAVPRGIVGTKPGPAAWHSLGSLGKQPGYQYSAAPAGRVRLWASASLLEHGGHGGGATG